MNLFADLFEFFKCRLFDKKLFLNNQLVYCRIFTSFFSVVTEWFLKANSSKSLLKNEQSMSIVKIVNIKIALLHRKCLLGLKWFLKKLSTILHSKLNHQTLPVTLFKLAIKQKVGIVILTASNSQDFNKSIVCFSCCSWCLCWNLKNSWSYIILWRIHC